MRPELLSSLTKVIPAGHKQPWHCTDHPVVQTHRMLPFSEPDLDKLLPLFLLVSFSTAGRIEENSTSPPKAFKNLPTPLGFSLGLCCYTQKNYSQ